MDSLACLVYPTGLADFWEQLAIQNLRGEVVILHGECVVDIEIGRHPLPHRMLIAEALMTLSWL